MHNLIQCELLKLKRKKFFIMITIAAFIFPIPLTALAMKDNLPYDTLLKFIILYGHTLILTPILSIAAFKFIDMEKNTLKNIVSIPISKNKLILCKLIILLIISIIYSVGAFGASLLGAAASSTKVFFVFGKLELCVMAGILTFISSLPCIMLIIAIGRNQIISILISFLYSISGFIISLSDTGSHALNLQTIMPISVSIRWLLPLLSKKMAINPDAINEFAINNIQCTLVMCAVLFISIPIICKLFEIREEGGRL